MEQFAKLNKMVAEQELVCTRLISVSCAPNVCSLTSDWVLDKNRSKFAFPAMCWERSFIPKAIWQVGDATSNIIESLHFEANTEGVSCTLVGGIQREKHLDILKEKTLRVRVSFIHNFSD